MLADIREYLIITSEEYLPFFKKLLGNGSKFGISIEYKTQKEPDGLAQAFLIGKNFIGDSNVALILGDNLFHGSEIESKLLKAKKNNQGATIFAYRVKNPDRYGVVEFDDDKKVISLEEKPKKPRSNYATTGIYFYDNKVVEYAKTIKPSPRGEYEITTINEIYLKKDNIQIEILGRGTAWLDTGTFDSLFQAGNFIRTIELRQGLQVGCPEEVSWRKGWISTSELEKIIIKDSKSPYANYLQELLINK